MSSCHRGAASYWAPFLPPSASVRSATFSFENAAVRIVCLSLFLSWSFGRAKPFLRQSPPQREGRRQSSNGPNAPRKNPLLSSPRKDRAHLFPLPSLSFCRDEDYCSRSFCRSLFSSFFITHPLIFGWLSLSLSLSVGRSSVSRGRQSKRGLRVLAVRRPNLIPCSDHHRPRPAAAAATISYLRRRRRPLSPLTHKPLIVHLGQSGGGGRKEYEGTVRSSLLHPPRPQYRPRY